MPKEPKKKIEVGASTRHAPLGQVIQDDANRGKYASRKISGAAFSRNFDEGGGGDSTINEEEELMDERTSKRILELSREQQREMEGEEEMERRNKGQIGTTNDMSVKMSKKQKKQPAVRRNNDDSSDEEDSDDDEEGSDEEDGEMMIPHDDRGYVTMADNAVGLTPEEEALLTDMMGNGHKSTDGGDAMGMGGEGRRNLADIIMAKIEEKEALAHANKGGMEDDDEEGAMGGMELPPKVVQVSFRGGILFHCELKVSSISIILTQNHTLLINCKNRSTPTLANSLHTTHPANYPKPSR